MKNNTFFFSILILAICYVNKINALYFEIEGDKERCFVDEFHKNTVVAIKYEIDGLDVTQEKSINYFYV
jgi:hypothetical protein